VPALDSHGIYTDNSESCPESFQTAAAIEVAYEAGE
jgi:hypothetical protein